MLPGLRLVPAPGHTRGSQIVVVETGGRSVVVGGDMAVFFAELDPAEVWLSHEHEPWRPQDNQHV